MTGSPAQALANIVTGVRLLLVAPIVLLILDGRPVAALVLLVLAVVTDALDGRLARRYGTTVLGSWLDVTADRLLVGAVVAALWWTGGLPAWATLILLLREAVIAAGALVAYAPQRPMEPLLIGKLHTASAFLLMTAGVAVQAGLLPALVVTLLGGVVVATAATSLAAYARRVARRSPGE